MDAQKCHRDTLQRLSAQGVEVARGRGAWWQRLLSWGAALACLTVFGMLAPRNLALWWVLPLALLAADFLSGLVHWLFDTRIAPGSGLLGRAAVNFLDHHVHPGRSARTGFAATTWRVGLVVTLPLLGGALAAPPGPGQAWLLWLAVLALVVAEAHKQAHRRCPARMVRWLQRWRLSLPPEAHRAHHRDHSRAYCVFTGWWNPLLDGVGFWRWLERWCGAGPADPSATKPRADADRPDQPASLSSRRVSPPY